MESVTIEFVGHAGSGKTFLRERLVEGLRERGAVAVGMKLTFTELLTFLLRRPRVFVDVVRLVAASKPASFSRAMSGMIKILIYQVKIAKACREKKGTIVFDEGMLHRLRMLRDGSNGSGISYDGIRPEIRRRLFVNPDLVVFVVASLETMARRKVSRDGAAREGVNEMMRRKSASYAASLRASEEDILAAQREHQFRYVKIWNDQDDTVEESIETMLHEIALLEEVIQGGGAISAQ